MGIDSSIYFQQKTPDILGSVERGLSLRQMSEARQKTKDLDQAYKAGIITNPDGSTSVDENRTLSALAKVGGQEYLEAKSQFSAQKAAQQKLQQDKIKWEIDTTAQLLGGVKDQNSWGQALQEAQKAGIDVSQMPPQYDPGFVQNLTARTLSAKDRFDQQFKEKELALKQRELGIKERSARNEAKSGEKLPLDKKKTVETLSTKNANKLAIKNQIDAVLANWNSMSEDQQVAAGRQLLKTLNSTEGADAIGTEEANRLGSKLEFAMGNFTNSNPTQFGRDLKGFYEQAENTAKGIGTAVSANQRIIDEQMGRRSAQAPSKPNQTFKTSEIEWAD